MSSNARKGKTSFPRLAVTLEHKHENLFLYSVLVSTANQNHVFITEIILTQ